MVFPTLSFLLFYSAVWPAAWIPVWAGRHRLHKLVLIVASYCFYAFWNWQLAFVLFACVLATWAAGRGISRGQSCAQRKLFAALGIAANLLVLAFFKYYAWSSEQLNDLLPLLGLARQLPLFEIIVPIGVSFFTLQGISYVVDVYRGDLDRARSLIDVTFFISFFPHLLAGPIVRAARLLPQLEKIPDRERVFVGLGVMLVIWGVFKKVVVANLLAVELVDRAFFDPLSYGTIDVVAAVYGYAVVIYCDFSGYSDIAIGIAALLGYRFQRNFDQPYRAASLREFWRRWHISLSSWLRDYLYIPLGGSRSGAGRTYVNLLLTVVLGGLWHGAAWHFVAWGAFHGGALAVERAAGGGRASGRSGAAVPPRRFRRMLAIAATFNIVCVGWILFRAESLTHAGYVLSALANWSQPPRLLTAPLAALIAVGLAIHFTPADMLARLDRIYHRLPTWLIGVMAGTALLAIEAASGGVTAPFIYFQF